MPGLSKDICSVVMSTGAEGRVKGFGEKRVYTNVQCHSIDNADKFLKFAVYCPILQVWTPYSNALSICYHIFVRKTF